MSDEDDFPALPMDALPSAVVTPGINPVATPGINPATVPGSTASAPPVSPAASALPVDGHTVLGRKMPPPPFPPEQSSMVVPAYEFPARVPRGVWGFAGGLLIGIARPWSWLLRGRGRRR